jgi:hypothetical protein
VTLMQDTVNDTRRMTYGGMSEQVNILATPYAGTDRLEFELDVAGITAGMTLSYGLNVWLVKEVATSAKTVYVIPEWDGSRMGAAPKGAVVYVRPRVTDWHLFNEVNRQIVAMSSRVNGLYAPRVEVARTEFKHWGAFVLSAVDAQSILGIRAKEPWAGQGWYGLQDRDWRWNPGTGEIRILSDRFNWMNEIEVAYRAPFRKAENLADDLEIVCGLPPTMQDIPPLGASANLLLTTEGRRNQVQVQGDSRRATEVQQSGNSAAAREMRRRFQDRIDEEHIRLVNMNPWRVSI